LAEPRDRFHHELRRAHPPETVADLALNLRIRTPRRGFTPVETTGCAFRILNVGGEDVGERARDESQRPLQAAALGGHIESHPGRILLWLAVLRARTSSSNSPRPSARKRFSAR